MKTRVDPNRPHPFQGGQRHEDGAPLCRHCGMTFTSGQHGEQRREAPLFMEGGNAE